MSDPVDQKKMEKAMEGDTPPPLTTQEILRHQAVTVDRDLGSVRSEIVSAELEIEQRYQALVDLRAREARLAIEERAISKAIEELDRPDWMSSTRR